MEARIKEKVGEDGTKGGPLPGYVEKQCSGDDALLHPALCVRPKNSYFTKRRYYVEHLVYALHIHTFLYMGVIVTSLLGGMGVNRWCLG